MKFSSFKTLALAFALTLFFAFIGCNTDNDNSNTENVEIIGKWQMYGTTKYGLEFTNYGIAIWKHQPYMNSNLDYSYTGTTLTVSGKNGTAIFSDNGNTLKISGFSNLSSFGAEGSTGPYINGTYIRQ